MSRKTAKLFDLMFKSIIKGASSSAIVHLINGIYKKNYPLDTSVKIEPTEFVKEHPKSGKLEKIVSDIIVTLSGENFRDTYLMEAQIDDDVEMSLRIFNYSIFAALEGRKISSDGSDMQIAKRKALSKELESYVIEIDKILKRCKENSYITSRDAAMLFRRLLYMNMELYGQYPEFKEVDMTLKDLADTDIDEAIDKAERRGLKQGVEKVFALLEKGMSLAEAKKKLSFNN